MFQYLATPQGLILKEFTMDEAEQIALSGVYEAHVVDNPLLTDGCAVVLIVC